MLTKQNNNGISSTSTMTQTEQIITVRKVRNRHINSHNEIVIITMVEYFSLWEKYFFYDVQKFNLTN
ncbi:hypothetical protein EKG60_02470 [Salmonella enterica subsp. enterica serovar Waycross]|nr:hypothetical protein [Salmonella enterica subsp. enterica serovar Waycross]